MASGTWMSMDELGKGFHEMASSLGYLDATSMVKNALFSIFLTLAIIQTFYPILMILAMFIRQLSVFAHYFHEVDEETNKHGGHLVAQVLEAHGIKQIFTLSGGHISPILTAAQESDIKVIDTRHEATAVFAADAAARLSGLPGVAVVTAGPGLTNTVTPVQNASMAESPVVVIAGAPATLLKGRGSLQDIDQISLMKPVTKWQKSVTKVRDIVPILREAFRQAQSDTPGPVFVEIPLDILYPYKIIRKEFTMKSRSDNLIQKCVAWYLDQYSRNLYAGAFDIEREYRPWPVELTFPKKSEIQKAAEMVSRAKRPIILLGSQATLPPVGAEQLAACVQSLGIPCFLGGMSRGLLGRNNPLHLRHCRREALKKSDCVVLAGAVADFRLDYGRILSSKSKIIAVNRSKEQLKKNQPFFWKATLSINADVGKFMIGLQEKLGHGQVDSDWLKELRQLDDERETQIAKKIEASTDRHLNPLKVLSKLEACLPDNTIIVADGGDFVGSASYILRPRGPLQWLDPGVFGTLGCGGGFALGAKAVKPDANVVVIFGDGALGFSFMEYDSFVRHKLPVMSVVGNDACWSQIEREQTKILGSDVACRLDYINYDRAAEGIGAVGLKLDASNEKELELKFRQSLDLIKEGKSVLINVLIGRTDFRDGSISV
ncbi:2-hydroxyacyl-CoA lyase 2-like [Brevipalpus obovatus]|uniref:2-hydroxyacyl-CoA lyase 2-like n=1 Tax=Brevipalpus obovatus TaxID=246614 RepID=UPI003D9E4CD8